MKRIISTLVLLLTVTSAFAYQMMDTEVTIGANVRPDASAVLQLESTTRGFLPPRMTEVQRDLITAASGLMIYNITTDDLEVWTGAAWISATAGGSAGLPTIGTSTDNAIARWNGTLGAAVQDSSVIISDTDSITGVVDLTMTGDLAAVGAALTGRLSVASTTLSSTPCPVMTEVQRDAVAAPLAGDCVYNSTSTRISRYDGTNWADMPINTVPEGTGLSTGILNGGGVLTANVGTPANFDISDGTGIVVDSHTDPNNPVVTLVAWTGITNVVLTNIAADFTFIGINSSGVSVQSVDAPFTTQQKRDFILIGSAVHVSHTTIDAISDRKQVAFGGLHNLWDLYDAIGPINVSGNVYSGNGANLFLDRTAGEIVASGENYQTSRKSPNNILTSSDTNLTWNYNYQDGVGGFTIQATQTSIVPGNYDDGDGTLGTVSNNDWSVQRIFYDAPTNVTVIQYGQASYNTFSEAQAGIQTEVFVKNPALDGLSFRTFLIVRGGATNLTSTGDAVFIDAGKFGTGAGGGGGAGASGDMQNAYDNSVAPQIVLDGTRNGIQYRDASTPIGVPLFSIQDNAGTGNFVNFDVNGMLLGTGARVSTVLDEDAMGSDSATALATQQSIKAYVDSQAGASTLQEVYDNSAPFLAVLDGTNDGMIIRDNATPIAASLFRVETTASANIFDIDVDGIILAAGTRVNEFSIDGLLAGDSDLAVPTEKAVKAYVDTEIATIIAGSVTLPKAWLRDQKTSGTSCGASTNTYTQRDLNTLVDPGNIISSLTSNQFIVNASGNYDLSLHTITSAAAGINKAVLYNVTDASDETDLTSTNNVGGSVTTAAGLVTLDSTKTYEIRHRATSAVANGWGAATSLGIEVCTTLEIAKAEEIVIPGNEWMSVDLWSGTTAIQSIFYSTAIDFPTDGGMLWMKRRDASQIHQLHDTVRGFDKRLRTDSSAVQDSTGTGGGADFVSFDVNGFTLGAGSSLNATGTDAVSWAFKEEVGAFDIVSYTGTGAIQNVSHSLGVKPKMMIIKSYTSAQNWVVYADTSAMGATKNIKINNTTGSVTSTPVWNDAEPNSTVFTIGSDSDVSVNTHSFIAYLFSGDNFNCYDNVPSSGTPITPNVGKNIKWVLFKKTSTTGDWYIHDTKRETTENSTLSPNLTAAEDTSSGGPSKTISGDTFTLSNWSGDSDTYLVCIINEP